MKIGYFSENNKEKGDSIIIFETSKESKIISDMLEFAAKHKDNKRKSTWQKMWNRIYSDLPIGTW